MGDSGLNRGVCRDLVHVPEDRYLSGDLHPDVLATCRSAVASLGVTPSIRRLCDGWRAIWTSILPSTDWSFQLLAMTNAAAALWAVDLIVRRFVRGYKRAVVLLHLMLLPVYRFHAQRFNANALLAIWPLATCCFLRSFETREIEWAAAAGALRYGCDARQVLLDISSAALLLQPSVFPNAESTSDRWRLGFPFLWA